MCIFPGLTSKSEVDHMLDDTELTVVSGENSGWFVDSDSSLSSSDSGSDEIQRLCKEENESETEFSYSEKGRVAM